MNTQGATVILARAGSQGVARKNVAMIADRPCIAWTIEFAQQSASAGTIIVTSDDQQILDIAASMGVVAHARPAELATASARVDDTVREAIAACCPESDPIVVLYGNVPIRPDKLLDDAVALLLETGCDAVQSVCAVGKNHPMWTVRVDDLGTMHPWQGTTLFGGVHRRQDLPSACIPDGGVLAIRRAALMNPANEGPHGFLGTDRRAVVTSPGEVVDIDAPIDLAVAQIMMQQRLAETSHAHR